MHRLQGLRGGLQGVERGSRRRHEVDRPVLRQHREPRRVHLAPRDVPGAAPGRRPQRAATKDPFRWVFLSDVCKHCANAGCLEACPTGAIVRTEIGSVYVQPDICNGCGYCVVTCPFGVIDKRPEDGRAFKCTLCYDRQKVGLKPACATACPTESIRFGPRGAETAGSEAGGELRRRGHTDARLYDRSRPASAACTPASSSSASRRITTCRRRLSSHRISEGRVDVRPRVGSHPLRRGMRGVRHGMSTPLRPGPRRSGSIRFAWAPPRRRPVRPPPGIPRSRARQLLRTSGAQAAGLDVAGSALFYFGGIAGVSAVMAFAAHLFGAEPAMVRLLLWMALVGAALCPPLLIADLGSPRFLNMLRVFSFARRCRWGCGSCSPSRIRLHRPGRSRARAARRRLPPWSVGWFSEALAAVTGLLLAS